MGTIPQVNLACIKGICMVLNCRNLETAIPYSEFKKAGFDIDFVTEQGNMPECDAKMLTGMTQKILVRISCVQS